MESVDWVPAQGSTIRTIFTYHHYYHKNCYSFKVKTGEKCTTPVVIRDDKLQIIHTNPSGSIINEDPLRWSGHNSRDGRFQKCNLLSFDMMLQPAKLRTVKVYHSNYYHTKKARILIWKEWQTGNLEGLLARMWEEEALRKEPQLLPYWRARNWCRLEAAVNYLLKNQHNITPNIQLESSQHFNCHLLLRVTDLLVMGNGGDSHELSTMSRDEDKSLKSKLEKILPNLHVVGLDSGTWPADGGGVASCRRDLVNRLEGNF